MPAITATSLQGLDEKLATVTTLDGATDTLVYNQGGDPILELHNPTGGGLTPTIIGDAAVSQPCPGVGDIDTSLGYKFAAAIAAGTTVTIKLDSIRAYLRGNISITGGTGLEAILYEQ